MRILIWCGIISIGGGKRLLNCLAAALKRQNKVEFIRIVIDRQTKFKEKLKDISGIEVLYTDSVQTKNINEMAAEFDLVYFFWPHGVKWQPIAKPIVCTFHDTIIIDYTPPFMSGAIIKEYCQSVKIWLEKNTKLVVASEYVKSRLIANFAADSRKIVVIPHAISPADIFSDSEFASELKNLLPKEYIVYPANTSPHKNHYNLLLAYSKFTERKKYPLVLFGYLTEQLQAEPPNWPQDPYLPTLISLIKREGLKPFVDFYPLGLISDKEVISVIKNAKGLIMPSIAEGGGSYPVEEALTLGVPVLCSDIPVMREQLVNRTAEISWFCPEDPSSITKALEYFTANYEYLKESTKRAMMDPRPNWDDIASSYIKVFQAAIQEY